VNAHMLPSMLRFPEGRAPCLTARYLFLEAGGNGSKR
jgi:hypothetical protein